MFECKKSDWGILLLLTKLQPQAPLYAEFQSPDPLFADFQCLALGRWAKRLLCMGKGGSVSPTAESGSRNGLMPGLCWSSLAELSRRDLLPSPQTQRDSM